MKIKLLPFLLISIISLVGCQQKETDSTDVAEVNNQEIEKLNNYFDRVHNEDVNDSPEWLSSLGKKDRQTELNDISEEHALKKLEISKLRLEELNAIDVEQLDEQSLLSYRLYKRKLTRKLDYQKYRHYNYPVTQMHGMHSGFPSFMINKHEVENLVDANAYVSRLNAITIKFDQLIEGLKIRESKGIIPPKYVFALVLSDCENIIGNKENIPANIFINDLTSKLDNSALSYDKKKEVLLTAETAIVAAVIPAYEKLISYLEELEAKSTTDDGVWKFEDGENFYNYRLNEITTTSLTGEEIFKTGEEEVARIHSEMNKIMKIVAFEGSLKEFFNFMKTDSQFYYEDSPKGKQQMEIGYQKIVDDMEAQLESKFYTKPKAKMQVKAVEEWREKSAGKAFYQRGTPDGKRKGTFYANLYKMADMPTYEMEALAYHEGIPGHHMQNSIAQELTDLPEFRKFSHYTAYGEGWGLYCEYLPKEMGFYKDPYSDFGRLAMELWRACRLVVDVGIHQKKWTREEAIKFLMDNTPNSENSCTKAIERYIVMPGQATAYKVGMIHILQMREKAKSALGEKFDIKKFHDIFLRSGGVPLEIFEEQIDNWILTAKKD